MEESNMHEKILVEINNRTFVIDSRIDKLEEKLDALEEKLQKIFWFIEFHLGEVPLKHRKFNPSKGEYPYFKTKQDFKTMPLHPGFICPGDNPLQEIEMPKDPKEYAKSREYMFDLGKKGWPKKAEHVPDLSDDKYYGNEQAWDELMERKKTNPNIEAWVEPKQGSSVASSTTSAGQDLPQADKPNESSPSSQESPDHKNPPSQT